MARREVLTVVPALVGLAMRTAQDMALDAQLLAVEAGHRTGPAAVGVVVAQSPSAGCYAPPGGRVRIWVRTDRSGPDSGDGGGGQQLPTGPVTLTPTGIKPR